MSCNTFAVTYCLDSARLPPGLIRVFDRSGIALSLADMAGPDQPLIAINEAFCRVTEFEPDQVLGRNCRFLQPPGGAGPVRERMRSFFADASADEARFVIPNVTRTGKPFLNIVYMAKLRHRDVGDLILGSQFADRTGHGDAAVYEKALRADLTTLSEVVSEGNWMLLGSMDAIANTTRILAQHYL